MLNKTMCYAMLCYAIQYNNQMQKKYPVNYQAYLKNTVGCYEDILN